MRRFAEFAEESPAIAGSATRLLEKEEVAFLATVSASGRPRLHPFVPKIVDGRMVAFIMNSSPKIIDLERRRQYAIHTLPGDEDEEFFMNGEAVNCDGETAFRTRAAEAMGFATGVDAHHVLFEFRLDRALWGRWLDFGTKDHRPQYERWRAS